MSISHIYALASVILIPSAGVYLTDAPAIWPMSVLFYSVGSILFFSQFRYNIISVAVYSLITMALLVLETSFFFSYYIQNKPFNDAFFYHLRTDLVHAGFDEHLSLIFMLLACLAVFLFFSALGLKRFRVHHPWAPIVGAALFILGLFVSPSAKALVAYTGNIPDASQERTDLTTNPISTRSEPAITFTGNTRPNIVLIYAESLEQRFFDESVFPGLLPNLKAIMNRSIAFRNVAQGIGASWTVGGMVASQCGYPLTGVHGVEQNNLSVLDRFLPGATCLGDLLERDGYYVSFIGGADARFAGKKDFLLSHGYHEVLSRDDLLLFQPDKTYLNEWGVYDDNLFTYAFRRFQALSQQRSPFLMTLLTLDTHGTKGVMSQSCTAYGTGNNQTLNAFHCTDQILGKFIEQIRTSPYSDNTVIVVASDHLSMRNQASEHLNASRMPERLTFFINTPQQVSQEIKHAGLHYDIAPTLLDVIGYNITSRIGFGAPLTKGPGYLPGRFGEDGWRSYSADLMANSQRLWDSSLAIDQNGIVFHAADLSLDLGGRSLNLRSWGYTYDLAPTLLLFDQNTLALESIDTYPFGRELKSKTLSSTLLQNKKKLALAIARAGHLPGFSEPHRKPDEWVYFFGKPGGSQYSWGPLTETLIIPWEVVEQLRQTTISEEIMRARNTRLGRPFE